MFFHKKMRCRHLAVCLLWTRANITVSMISLLSDMYVYKNVYIYQTSNYE
jgi:hypothetical protein